MEQAIPRPLGIGFLLVMIFLVSGFQPIKNINKVNSPAPNEIP